MRNSMEFLQKNKKLPYYPEIPLLSIHEKEMKFKRYTGGGVCDVCNCSLNGKRAYIVPNHTFYTSRKYRNWVNSNGMNAMFGIITPDAEFDRREAMDHSAGSAVCEDCIHLFE